jgi:signal transduction histidine kinase
VREVVREVLSRPEFRPPQRSLTERLIDWVLELVGRLLAAQEEERHRIAYDVHDGLAQVAASAHQHLQAFARHHRPRTPHGRAELDRVLELARQTVEEARRVVANLRPVELEEFGLAHALRLQVEELRAAGWEVMYDEDLGARHLPPAVETALYRVAQEALTNLRKHAHTSRARVAIESYGQTVRLEVQDWGRGFAPGATRRAGGRGERIGLLGMRERIALLGGRCTVESYLGIGTRVVAEVPLGSPMDGCPHEE